MKTKVSTEIDFTEGIRFCHGCPLENNGWCRALPRQMLTIIADGPDCYLTERPHNCIWKVEPEDKKPEPHDGRPFILWCDGIGNNKSALSPDSMECTEADRLVCC